MTSTLLDAATARWERAARRVGSVSRTLTLDGNVIELRIAGTDLVPALLRAIEHHERPAAGAIPMLTVRAWDGSSTGVSFPVGTERGRWAIPAWRRGVAAPEVPTAGIRVVHQANEHSVTILGDVEAVHWAADSRRLPSWERAAPLLLMLHWWLASRGLQLVHAAAVGSDRGAVLVVGPSGSGKSTTALACLAAGFDYLGDDYTLVDPAPPIRAVNLYRTAKLAPGDERRLDFELPPAVAPASPSEKAVYYLDHGIASALPLRAVWVAQVIGHGPSRLARLASAGPALSALAPSTIMQLPGSGARALDSMRRVCRSLPCYRLELGADPRLVPTLLCEGLA